MNSLDNSMVQGFSGVDIYVRKILDDPVDRYIINI